MEDMVKRHIKMSDEVVKWLITTTTKPVCRFYLIDERAESVLQNVIERDTENGDGKLNDEISLLFTINFLTFLVAEILILTPLVAWYIFGLTGKIDDFEPRVS